MNYEEYFAFAKQLAQEAGVIARKYFSYDTAAAAKDADGSPITIADEQINELVIQKVRAAYPGMGVLGEEASLEGTDEGGLLWVLDPIDGTIPYTLHMPISTFCLALVGDGEPVVGVVYDFMNDRLYGAIKGKGAELNGEPLVIDAAVTPLKLAEVEKWPAAPCDVSALQQVFASNGYSVLNYASFGYVCMMVALRKLAAAVYAGDKPWDVAAAKVILEELGIVVTDVHGGSQRYDGAVQGAIVAYPEMHRLLMEGV